MNDTSRMRHNIMVEYVQDLRIALAVPHSSETLKAGIYSVLKWMP